MKIKIPHEIEITKKHLGAIAVIALLCIGYAVIDTETLTLRAYYPSPVGIYTRLVSLNKATFAREKGNVVLTSEKNPTGMVGIGTTDPKAKLDVRGIIKVSADNTTNTMVCGQDRRGAIRYFSANSDDPGKFQYCDGGTEWKDMGGADGGPCPSGFNDTGYGYCIQNVENPAVYTWFEASRYCAANYNARLCRSSEWYLACVNGKASGMGGNFEWGDDFGTIDGGHQYVGLWGGNTGVSGGGGCNYGSSWIDGYPGDLYNFRCCRNK